jgi:hypothetical protein
VKPVLLYSSEVWGMFDMTSKLKKSKKWPYLWLI